MGLISVLTLYMQDIYKGGLAAEPVECLVMQRLTLHEAAVSLYLSVLSRNSGC